MPNEGDCSGCGNFTRVFLIDLDETWCLRCLHDVWKAVQAELRADAARAAGDAS
ncbi:MAG: hypothetical protein OXC11_03885 [Rhodospirillales bacterium]|nr:hypothetical protein [Rhodospirillales bacterium]